MKKNKLFMMLLSMIFTVTVIVVPIKGLKKDIILNLEENAFINVENFQTLDINEIPKYNGKPYALINNNIPKFNKNELTAKGYEKYSKLDSLGRCRVAIASIGKETMPKQGEKRGEIGNIRPSGFKQEKYDIIKNKYLYNRCHLIGWQLSSENANKNNLITGTNYLNIEGMLIFENMVHDYVLETGNHVLYRVTPIYEGNNLLASGVNMEALSVEDNGEGISFNVYCFNVQPGININYLDGSSKLDK